MDMNLRGRGLRGESFADVARRQGSIGGMPVSDTATDADVLDILASASTAAAESLVGPSFASTAAGIAGTSLGDFFAVTNGDGTVSIYLHDTGGVATIQRTLATTTAAFNYYGRMAPVAVGVVANQGAIINAALAANDVVILPSGDIYISEPINIPNGKLLIGQGIDNTIIKPMVNYEDIAVNPAIIDGPGSGGTCGIFRLTVNGMERGLGEGAGKRVHGIRLGYTQNFIVENCSVINCTGYGFWAVGSGNDVTLFSSGTFRHCYTDNCSVHFEATACDGLLFEDCHGRKAVGVGNVATLSFFHPLTDSRRITFRNCSGIGEAAAGIDPSGDAGTEAVGLSDITIDNCHFELTFAGPALSVAPGQPHPIERLRIINSTFLSPTGMGASFLTTNVEAIASRFSGTTGVYGDGIGGFFDGCTIEADGVSSVALVINALKDTTKPLRIMGHSRLTATGGGSATITGRSRVWFGADVEFSPMPAWVANMVVANKANTTVSALAAGYYEVHKSAGSAAFDASADSNAAFTGNFQVELYPRTLMALYFGVATAPDTAADTSDIIRTLFLNGSGEIFDTGGGTALGTYAPGDRFWMARYGDRLEFRHGGARYEDSNLLYAVTQAGNLYFDCSMFTVGDKFVVRGLA